MVFKKPYGFLIKHFKLIHLILTGLYIYLTMKVNSLLGYYNDYILGTVGKLDAIGYVTNYYMIAVVLSIIICIIVYALLRYKKKPRVLYLGLIGFVIIVALMINLVYGGLETIYFSVLDVKTMRFYRDLLRILVVFQYISIGFVLVRALGFDIKKFNFVQDLQELKLDVSDEEEVELTLGSTNSLQRKINRRIREFKYYYLENKIFIHVILIGLLIFGISSYVFKEEVIDKEYEQGESFATDEFHFRVLNTFVTKKDYNNQLIGGEDDSFVVVRMTVTSNGDKKELNTGNLVLVVNYNSYTCSGYYGARFIDLGTAYKGQKIGGVYTYLFIYQVNKTDVDKKMKIVYAGDRTVNLKPEMLDEVEDVEKYKIGDNIDLSKSSFESGNLKIKKFELAETFSYSYDYEIEGKTYTSQYVISSLKGAILKLKINSAYPSGLDDYTFLDTYAVLKYKIGDEEYSIKAFDDKTPGNEKKELYLAVDKKMLEAQEIWLDIKIRNKHYVYTIK